MKGAGTSGVQGDEKGTSLGCSELGEDRQVWGCRGMGEQAGLRCRGM